jgi:hypothetical protein
MKPVSLRLSLLVLLGLALLLAACARPGSQAAATPTPQGKSLPVPQVSTALPSSGDLPTPGAGGESSLAVEWRRTGGIAGICRLLKIQVDGSFTVQDCRQETSPALGILSDAQLSQLNDLLESYTAFQWETPVIKGSADMFNDQYTFNGVGTAQPTPEEQVALNTFLAQVSSGSQAENTTPSGPVTPTTTPPPGQSGIEGQSTIGPACAGPVRVGQSCPDKPYQATLAVLDAAGKTITQFQTAADGIFRVSLPPGQYTLHPVKDSAFPSAADQAVTVLDGQFTQVLVQFDSGIR